MAALWPNPSSSFTFLSSTEQTTLEVCVVKCVVTNPLCCPSHLQAQHIWKDKCTVIGMQTSQSHTHTHNTHTHTHTPHNLTQQTYPSDFLTNSLPLLQLALFLWD